MSTVREIRRLRRRVRVGASDPSLTPVSGLAAVTELVDRLNMITLFGCGDRAGQGPRSRVHEVLRLHSQVFHEHKE